MRMGSYVEKGVLGSLGGSEEVKNFSNDSFTSHESAGSIKPFEMIEHYIEHQSTISEKRVFKTRMLKWQKSADGDFIEFQILVEF
jgi:hypothetical protein